MQMLRNNFGMTPIDFTVVLAVDKAHARISKHNTGTIPESAQELLKQAASVISEKSAD